VVSFNWAYETFDSPYFDAVGFVHDGVITLVADPNGAVVNGIFSANVLAGQTFGFWLDTAATAATAARGPGSATSRRRCPSRARWHWSRWASPLQA
jgi:hypothetical protein